MHLPYGVGNNIIPTSDPVGNDLQSTTTEVAAQWTEDNLTEAENNAIQDAIDSGEAWRANLLKQQAKGRWVEKTVKEKMNQTYGERLAWSGTGIDIIDTQTGVKYDIMSGTTSNMDTHAKRMNDVFFRFITF